MTDPLIGRFIGGYQIVRLIGEGGMGRVYVAENPGLRKRMAVKVLLPEFGLRRDIVDRFFKEARASAGIGHRAVVEVIDAAYFPQDNQPYITMPFLEGRDLGEHVDQLGKSLGHPGRVPVETAWRLLSEVIAALRMAHARGIVHRDIKPSNLYVCEEPDGVTVKVLDFGLAKLLHDDSPFQVGDKTQSRQILGTPGYMPPEQFSNPKDVDHRADIYAIGVVAYRILTARLPFEGAALGEVVLKQVQTTPPRPSSLVPEIPPGIDAVIMACLAADPANRPQDMHQLAMAWAAALPGGREIAEEAGLLAKATPTERTVPTPMHAGYAPTSSPPLAKPGEVPVLSAWSSSSPAAAAVSPSAVSSSPMAAATAPRRGLLIGAIVVVAALTAGAIALLVGTGRDNQAATIDAAVEQPVALAPIDAAVVEGQARIDAALPADAAAPAVDAAHPAATRVDAAPPIDASPAPPVESTKVDAGNASARPETPQRPGSITVIATPWADVTIDKKFAGTAPVTVEVSAGRHTVQLEHEGGTETVHITVKPGKNTRIERSW